MDIQSLALSKKNTSQEIEKVNQKINQVSSGIKSIVPSGNQLIFTLADNSTISVTLNGLSTNDFNDIFKTKLSSLNSDLLNKFSYNGTQLLFDRQPIGSNGTVDLSGYATKNGNINENFSVKDMNVQGNIMPTGNGTQSIGSPTNRFKEIYVNEAKLSVNTLYLGDTPVMGTNQDTIVIKGDKDQSITMKTTGVGTTNLISEGNVALSTSGMNANVNVQATGQGANANLSATNQVNINAPNVNITGSTDVKGSIAVDNLTIRGNVAMQGQTFDVEATTVRVEDNIIELNKNEVGYGVTAGRAGLKINRGDADAYLLVFDETDDIVKVGTDSTLQNIATQNYVDAKDLLKADKVHNHSISDVNGLQASLDAKANTTSIPTKNSQLTNDSNFVADSNYIHTDNNYTTIEKNKVANTSGTNTGDETTSSIKTKLGSASASTDGYLTSTDWNTFNNKAKINDNGTIGDTTESYSIDKMITLLSNKQNKLYLQNTQPSSPIINDIWINNTNTPYTMSIYNGTSFIQVGSSSNGVGITDWTSNSAYTINTSFVLYNNLLYRCIVAHTSTTTFDISKWQFIGGDNAISIYGTSIDNSSKSNGKGLFYNSTTDKIEWANVNVTGIIGSSQLSQPATGISLNSGAEAVFSHPSVIDSKLMINIQEQVAGSSVTDTHIDFGDSSKYTLQDSKTIGITNNKLSLLKSGGVDDNTKLMLHLNTDFTDYSFVPHIITNSNVIIDTTIKKFGTGSASFNGSSSYLSPSYNTDFNFGTGNFTIDWWEYKTSANTNSSGTIHISTGTIAYGILMGINDSSIYISSGTTSFDIANGKTLGNVVLNSWQHLALVRNGNTFYTFRNGVLQDTWTSSLAISSSSTFLNIGRYTDGGGSHYMKGNLDEIRISNIARWTANFTPPNIEYYTYLNNTPLYTKTTGLSDFSLSTTDTITSLTVPTTIPTNTSIKCLFSVDNYTNYLYFDGTNIQKFTGDLAQSWGSTSSTVAQIQTLFTNLTITTLTTMLSSLGITPINLDLIFQLNTTDNTVTPSVSAITMVYITKSHTEFASFGSYDETNIKFAVKRINSSQLSVKNLTTKTRVINVNTIIGI